MSDEYGTMFEDDADTDELQVEPIIYSNAMEEAAQRYWRASRIWRDKEASNWNYGMIIGELRDIRCYRGSVAPLASNLMEDVVHDRHQPILNLEPEQQIVAMESMNDL